MGITKILVTIIVLASIIGLVVLLWPLIVLALKVFFVYSIVQCLIGAGFAVIFVGVYFLLTR